MDELIRVISQQNNLSHGNNNQSTNDSSMQNVQSLLEGLYQQTANMQKVMEENAGHLKRLVEAALSNSPSKRQSRLSSRLSKSSNVVTNNNSNDTVEVKRQDLQAIVKAGSDIMKSPTRFVSQIENFASAMLDQERNKSEVLDGIHLFKELAPALEKYVSKFATFSKLHKELLKGIYYFEII
jgi:hypothetical protein